MIQKFTLYKHLLCIVKYVYIYIFIYMYLCFVLNEDSSSKQEQCCANFSLENDREKINTAKISIHSLTPPLETVAGNQKQPLFAPGSKRLPLGIKDVPFHSLLGCVRSTWGAAPWVVFVRTKILGHVGGMPKFGDVDVVLYSYRK